jgi:predicted nucleotide-binding protein (sugar kinase/HSP70/actin superfamily)
MVIIFYQAHHFIYTEYPTLNKGEEMPTKVIVDCSTGETSIVELTAEEIADLETARLAAEDQRKAEESEAAAKAEAKATLLDKLGITEDEAKLLLS